MRFSNALFIVFLISIAGVSSLKLRKDRKIDPSATLNALEVGCKNCTSDEVQAIVNIAENKTLEKAVTVEEPVQNETQPAVTTTNEVKTEVKEATANTTNETTTTTEGAVQKQEEITNNTAQEVCEEVVETTTTKPKLNEGTGNTDSGKPALNTGKTHKVGVFFGNWKIYLRKYQLCSVPGDKIDRFYYAFLDPSTGVCKFNDPWADLEKPGPEGAVCGSTTQKWDATLKGNLYQLQQLKKRFPHMKVLASVGGWTYGPKFHEHMQKSESRASLAKSCVEIMNQYTDIFDGIDLDLEFPCLATDKNCGDNITPSSDDKNHFTALVKAFKDIMPVGKELTIAPSAAKEKLDALDVPALEKMIDAINIMSYDYTSGSWGVKTTGHQTNPYVNPSDPIAWRKTISAELSAKNFVAAGASASKINIGVGFYGRGFKVEAGSAVGPFVPATGGLDFGTWEKGSFEYYDIKNTYAKEGTVYFDDIAKAPYIFDASQGIYITYDDVRSIHHKVDLVKKHNYEGVFAWELSGDSDDYELLTAMNADVNRKASTSESSTTNNGGSTTTTTETTVKPSPVEGTKCKTGVKRTHKTGVFFGNWKIYLRGFNLCSTPGDELDVIYYAFLDPTLDGKCRFNDNWADLEKPGPENGICGSPLQKWASPLKGNMYQLKMLKQRFPHLKVFASVGGWTYGPGFHKNMLTPEARLKLAQTCGEIIKQYADIFDGLDVDLEFPCLPDDKNCGFYITPSSNDKDHFTELIKAFKKEMPVGKWLTIAPSAAPNKLDALDLPKIDPLLDSINIMSYDFTAGSWGHKFTGHQTNVYINPADPIESRRTLASAHAAEYLVKLGATPSKLKIGVAFYGRGFKVPINSKPGPFQPAIGGLDFGTWEKNNFDYYDIKKTYSGGGKNIYYDEVAAAPYIYDPVKGIHITYDDPRSICEKIIVAKKNGYMGVFAWELSGDTDDFELTKAMAMSPA